MLAHIPGLRVVIPSSPERAYGLLLAAIRDPDPVVFLEPTRIYRAAKGEVEDNGEALPLDVAFVLREGRDVTLISWGAMVKETLAAAETLAAEGISAEVIDLATLKPYDEETVLGSVAKTGRCVIVHEAARTGGFGAEIAALIAERGLTSLLAPVARVTGYDTVMPLPRLEQHYMPSVGRIVGRRDARLASSVEISGAHPMRQFMLPDLGEGLEEAEIVTWHVNEGDHVVTDQPLVSVETDKAVVEVPSPWSGRIARLFGAKGDLVKVGAPLVEFAEGAEQDTGTVVGELDTGEKQAAATESTCRARAGANASGASGGTRARAQARCRSQPRAGHRARRHHHARRRRARRQEPRRGRSGRGAARACGAPWRSAWRRRMPKWFPPRSPTRPISTIGATGEDATIRLVRAIAAACKAEPSLNAWYNAEAGERRLVKRIDIGIAVDTEGGLIVPVLRNVGERDARDLRAGLDRLRADAAARSIPPEELRGATITLSNFGMIGGRFASLVVVPPQVAIVGAGRIDATLVVAHQGQPAVRRVLPLSLTFDHRVVTGGEAARFIVALKSDLERPS